VPQGSFDLRRHPERAREQLRAWDTADQLLLARVADLEPATTLVLNDAFGALSVPLAAPGPAVHALISLVDSECSATAIQRNLERTGRPPESVALRPSTGDLSDLTGRIDRLIVRPPRNLALLEHLLRLVRPLLAPGATVVGAEMVKHLHSSTLEVFGRVLGSTTTTRAEHKARAIHCTVDPELDPGPWPWPRTLTLQPGPLRVIAWPGVFAAGRLDRGTSLLLDHLPETDGPESILDLGCGNGVLGTVAAMENADAQVTLVDDSALAVASAAATFAANVADGRVPTLVHAGSLVDPPVVEQGSMGLVLCNPPFHEHRAMGDAVAWQMFNEARQVLRSGGELWVVGNRHLAYHAKLNRLFGNCEVVASSPKFVVLRAVRR
jgi:16S rRNA (guanine1207-N2)-methyltransferase